MSYRKPHYITIILKAGQSQRPEKLICRYKWCNRQMMRVNRPIAHELDNCRGIHWREVPEDVTVVEHKCRGCDYYYYIYTPETKRAEQAAVEAIAEGQSDV